MDIASPFGNKKSTCRFHSKTASALLLPILYAYAFPIMGKIKATNRLRLIAFVVPITFGRHTYLCYYYTSYYLYYNISLILDLSTFILSETGFRLTLPRDTAHYFSPIRSENRKK
jgi:hypothetical protein